MSEFLEKIGLIELLAYICPGVIILASLALWIDLKKIEGVPILKQDFVLAVFGTIVCYTVGLIVASFASRFADLYIRLKRKSQVKKGRTLMRTILWVITWLPESRTDPSTVEANLRIAEATQNYSGLQGLSLFAAPWDRLVLYRTFVADRVGDRGKTIRLIPKLIADWLTTINDGYTLLAWTFPFLISATMS